MKNNQVYNGLSIKISCVSLNFKKLDKNSLEILKSASFSDAKFIIEKFKKKLGFDIEQLAIIQKCNAIIIFIVYDQNISFDFLKSRIFDVWDELSIGGIVDYLNQIVFYEDELAIKYIAECALGLHSVVVGDSQVFSQVSNAIQLAAQNQNSNPTLSVLFNWLRILLEEVKEKTAIFSGNTSLERIAVEKLNVLVEKEAKICILGLGMSGSLLVKILLEEYGYDVIVANRSENKISDILVKYPKLKIVDLFDFQKIIDSKVIIFALDNNKETVNYFNDLGEKIISSHTPKIVIDLSTPSVSKKQQLDKIIVIDIEDLSKEANKTIKERSSEVNKVHQIIGRNFSLFSDKLKTEIGKTDTENEKTFIPQKLSPQIVNIMKIRSKALFCIRNYLVAHNFYEINTPYIVGVSTDPPKVDKGGAIEVVWSGGKKAFLRQSNQLYKQMVVVSGIEKVFEIGPFWRAESEKTFRHLVESIGLDVEFSSPKSLNEVLILAYSIIFEVYKDFKNTNLTSFEISLPEPEKLPVITYMEAIDLLNKNGFPFNYGIDLGIIGEAKLGEIMRKKNHSDVFAIINYPSSVKKFYTKQSALSLTETFDIIVGGWELVSGALREVDRKKIEHSMKLSGLNPTDYNFYLSIVDNAVEHGGFGLGIDRLIARLLDINVVSGAVPFPRTFDQLIP
ncbi:MAG TPA: amino acid--tRNA ligase-related protein [Patescibacteria group bacterium]|jgi:aspartyl-tRNA synthetase|nr:amino acid--tRNA ligase-related protein [Patescibacteria group bacterium]